MITPYGIGQRFHSKDSLGKELKFVITSVEPAKSELYNNWYYISIYRFKDRGKWVIPEEYKRINAIKHSLELITTEYVEQEWFNQRTIKEI